MSPGLSKRLLMFIWVELVICVVDVVVVEDVSVVVVSSLVSCKHITEMSARKITKRGNCFFMSITPAGKVAE
ncbi:MAG: hypothetical protein U9M95_01625 [Candidatus Altiarchaeota archaeon]|nr:hypothetical protein [Candidatus Altiarchaeota archaeon]